MAEKKDFTELHEEMIKGNYKRSTKNEEDIENLEKQDISFKGELKAICDNVRALTKVLWFLGTAIIATLIAEIVKGFFS